ncbi:MAG: tetratricopeptide repeat protein [Sulfuriferula sp.]
MELDRILKKAYDYACKTDYQTALEICEWLIQEKSTEMAGYRKRASVREHMGNFDGAISDLQHVVSFDAKEPADFYGLGLLQLQQGFTAPAVDSFSKAIELGSNTGFHYYTQGSLLFRAEAYLKLCEFEKAIEDCSALPTDYKTYVSSAGMRSKEDIFNEANAALKAKGRKA